MVYNVVLSADRTIMSEYNDNPFYGFTSCMYHKQVPKKFFFKKIIPPEEVNKDGTVKFASLFVRKAEASLLIKGYDVKVTDQYNFPKVINKDTKVVGLTVVDPLGFAPGSTAFRVFQQEASGYPHTMVEFQRFLKDLRELRKKKGYDFKIVVGGPGVWQFKRIPEAQDVLGIDILFFGEAEITFPEVVEDVFDGKEVKKQVTGKTPEVKDIPRAMNAVNNGIIEIARGCGRGCKFCCTTLSGKIRSLPIEQIIEEVKMNVKAGRHRITIMSEDFLAYKRKKDFYSDEDAIINLFKEIQKNGGTWIRTIHANLASIAAHPELIEKITKMTRAKGQRTGFCQPGIETGSDRHMRELMPGKLLPFKNESWPDIIRESFKVMAKNNWISCPTIILGFPGETKDDVKETTKLVESLKPYRSAFATMFFIPISTTSLGKCNDVILENLHKEHFELIKKCWKHNIYHLRRMRIGDNWLAIKMARIISSVSGNYMVNFACKRLGEKYSMGLFPRFMDSLMKIKRKFHPKEDVSNWNVFGV